MPPEELVNTYLPQFSGILDRYAGRNGIHFHSEYLGASVLALVGLAFGRGGGPRRAVWFWTGVLVVSTLWALGGFTPFYSIVYAIVPGTKYFRAPSTMLYVVSFAAPCSPGSESTVRSRAAFTAATSSVGSGSPPPLRCSPPRARSGTSRRASPRPGVSP
jgi:hypothetical protein